jgi:hypothetical protein
MAADGAARLITHSWAYRSSAAAAACQARSCRAKRCARSFSNPQRTGSKHAAARPDRAAQASVRGV